MKPPEGGRRTVVHHRTNLPGLSCIVSSCVVAIGVLGIFLGCGSPQRGTPSPGGAQAPRLVILYATCTLNKDYLSPYNQAVTYTPNLDVYARHSTVFTRHVTETGQSGPAFASIFSGNQAYRHGVYFHPTRLPDHQYLISEAYADSGYETYFWGGHPVASAELNYGQGVPAENTFDRLLDFRDTRFVDILERLAEDDTYKAFVMTNFTVTHSAYGIDNLQNFIDLYPSEAGALTIEEIRKYHQIYLDHRLQLQWNFPETVAGLQLSAEDVSRLSEVVELLYKSRVHVLDTLFGGLMGQISRHQLSGESLVAFTADHGEVLYREHLPFKWVHGLQLAPEVLNVPLMIHSPFLGLDNRTWADVTRSIDLFPTMLGLSGLAMPAAHDVEGVDLAPALAGQQEAPALLAFSHTAVPKEHPEWTLRTSLFPAREFGVIWTSVREESDFYKLRYFGGDVWGFEVFDLEHDPAASQSSFDAGNPKHRRMAKKLRDYKSLLRGGYTLDPERRLALEDETSLLRSLGYVE